jgi:hypothetical protein
VTINRTLETFRAAHDPMFGIKDPLTVYARDLRPGFKVALTVAAQNATPVHADFWACLLTVVKHRKAEMFVIPTRYKNPTSHWSGSQKNAEYYDPAVVPYLWNQNLALNSNLMLMGRMRRQPTTTNPLAGLDGMSHMASSIIGHAKLQSRTVATPGNRMPKILTSTGACTVLNYTDTPTGGVGEFHHSLSAIIVELDGEAFHMRQLHYSKTHNAITDGVRGVMYLPNGKVKKAPRPLALGQGDTHVDVVDPAVDDATFRPDGLVQTLRPENVIWADLLDANSITHHDEKDPLLGMAKERAGVRNIKEEVGRTIAHVKARTFPGIQNIIQASNHNDMLRRWVSHGIYNGFKDVLNAPFGLKIAAHLAEHAHMGDKGASYPDPYKWLVDSAKLPQTRVLDLDESFALAEVELGMHGDMGPNGARGSRKNLARIGTKSIIFHSHSPGIEEGCYQAGTSTKLRLSYNHGPSSWLNAHVLLQHDGKRQIVNIIDGKYTAA